MTPKHIPIEKLVDLAAGRAVRDEVDQMRLHLAKCTDCTSQLTDLELQENRLRAAQENAPTTKHVKAVLSFDSRNLSPAFGIRSGLSVARQLLFSAAEYDLDLRVAPDDGAWVLSGQILGECEHGQVELRGENISERTELNELCEFNLARVPSGSYSLLVRTSNIEIEVPVFELKA